MGHCPRHGPTQRIDPIALPLPLTPISLDNEAILANISFIYIG